MEQATCHHKYRLKFSHYLIEWFPMGTKQCDFCGCGIHLNWFWRILFLITLLIPPTALYALAVLTRYQLPIWESLLVFTSAYCAQLFLSWGITRHGKYVLKADKRAARIR